jgi:hypothetical protein
MKALGDSSKDFGDPRETSADTQHPHLSKVSTAARHNQCAVRQMEMGEGTWEKAFLAVV